MTDKTDHPEASSSKTLFGSKLRHEWYQSDTEVVISVFIKNVKDADLETEILERSLSLNVKLPTGADAVFDLDPLSHSVIPARSTARTLSTKIEIKLAKAISGIKWHQLEGEDSSVVPLQTPSSRNGPSYPTSARQKTNWDKIVKEVTEEDAKVPDNSDPNGGGDVALNKLFQKLYADATDEQRMAMMKSYQESNGTALSTDWGQVKRNKVETHPPDGMVAKKW